MRSSPIYNKVTNHSRQSGCSFGAKDYFKQKILVGTSARNSHELADIEVDRRPLDNGQVRFTLWIDGEKYRSGVLTGQEFHREDDR